MRSRTLSLAILCALPFAASAQNVNLDLSGFATQYTLVTTPGPTAMFAEGTYALPAGGVAPQNYHYAWTSSPLQMPDGSMPAYMLVNGYGGASDGNQDPSAGPNLWSKTLVLGAGVYNFNFMATSALPGEWSPAQMDLVVDGGAPIVDAANVPWNGGVFVPHSIQFAVSNSGPHTLTLQDFNQTPSGNDFAVAAVPEPAPFAFLGLGLLGFLRRRRS